MNADTADLASALAAALEHELEMDASDACEIAHIVSDAFGTNGEVEDESLPQDLRSIFYTLEKQRWLTFRREERRTEEGSLRRVFYWTVRWDEIMASADASPQRSGNSQGALTTQTVYDKLPQNAWRRGISA